VSSSPPVPLSGLLCDRGRREMPGRVNLLDAPSTGAQTQPQPQRVAMGYWRTVRAWPAKGNGLAVTGHGMKRMDVYRGR
jgi:hypothetical protein